MKKKLSVIIPAFNMEKFIVTTLSSLVCQDLSKVELIIVNDGSTDNTVNITDKYLKRYKFIDYFILNKPNGGVSSARNVGLENSNGEFVFFLDSDDFVSDNFFEKVIPLLNHKNIDILSWSYDKVNEHKKILESYKRRFKIKPFELTGIEALKELVINGNYDVWTCSAIYSIDLINKYNLRFTDGCTSGEDLEFIYKSLMHANTVKHIPEVLSFYNQREGSVMNSFNINKYDSVVAMERVVNYIKSLDNSELSKVLETIKTKDIFDHYLITTFSYFKYESRPTNKKLFYLIDNCFPNLRKRLKYMIDFHKPQSKIELIKKELMLINPKLYYRLSNLKKNLINRCS